MSLNPLADIIRRAKEMGFARLFPLSAAHAQPLSPDIRTLLILGFPYEATAPQPVGCIYPDAFYMASQHAYQAAKALAAEFDLFFLPEVRLKPLFLLIPGLHTGKNTLCYDPEYGSRVAYQLLGLREMPGDLRNECPPPISCPPGCRACARACPTGAIGDHPFDTSRCLRHWMLPGAPIPEHMRALMGSRLLGCDECQRACPLNRAPLTEPRGGWPICRLLPPDDALLAHFGAQVGVNYQNRNRLTAQAALVAGNSGNAAYIAPLEKLLVHPSRAVAEHAAWAVARLKNDV